MKDRHSSRARQRNDGDDTRDKKGGLGRSQARRVLQEWRAQLWILERRQFSHQPNPRANKGWV
eukprot:4937127-Amphidinium_carterae.1